MKIDFKKLMPWAAAVVIFLAISLIYFSPVIGGKKELRQGDIINYKGASKEIVDFREKTGEEALWTNAMFGGMPAYQISITYGNNLVKYIDQLFELYLPHPAGLVFLYFIGFFILLLCLKVNPWLALVGSIAYGFSSYFFIILEAGHNTKAHAIGYMAPLLGSILLTVKGNKYLGFSLTALFTALELYANHVQITYYLLMLVGIIMVSELFNAFKEKALKSFFISCLLLLLAGGIGVLPNITNLWATYEYGKYSNRGKTELTIKPNKQSNADIATSGLDKEYATQWSYGIGETFTLLVPDFKGGASEQIAKSNKNVLKKIDPQYREGVGQSSAYYGNQPFTSGPVYAGAIMVALALLGLFLLKGSLKWALLIGTALSIMLAWGKNLMWFSDLFFDYVPAYNKFRAVSMILVIAELTIPLLAVLGIQELYKRYQNNPVEFKFLKKSFPASKVVLFSFTALSLLLLLMYVSPGTFTSFQADNEYEQMVAQVKKSDPKATDAQIDQAYAPYMENIEEARSKIFKADVLRSLGFVLFGGALVFFYSRKKLNQGILIGGLAVLVLADMWPVVNRYLNKENYVAKSQNSVPYFPKPADEIILQDKDPNYRVLKLGNPFNDASTSYFHKSIGGYHGAKLKRYLELIDFHIDRDYSSLINALQKGGMNDSLLQEMLKKRYILNMLNTKYIIYNEEAPPIVNKHAFGNAWFVTHVNYVENADKEITKLGEIDPRWYAIINEKYKVTLGNFDPKYDSTATIKLKEYKPNFLSYESNSRKEQLALFSEIYYPKGWNAYIDGTFAEHVNANYVLRALKVPAGKHKIEFKFEPKVIATGEKVSMAGSLILILVMAGGVYMFYRKEKTTKA